MALRGRGSIPVALVVMGALAGWQGCGPTYHKEDADREVYRILAAKQHRVLGVRTRFTVEPPAEWPLERLGATRPPTAEEAAPVSIVPEKDAAEKHGGLPPVEDAVRLTLRDALQLAAAHSREYQSRKEDLYLAALALTGERFRWRPQWSGALGASATDGPDDDSVGAGSDFSVSQLLALGGQVTVGLATDLLKYTTGDPGALGASRTSAASLLTVEVLQPLWRGAGRRIALESLTQAEREVVYAVRAFARFRKRFCVDVTSRYYRALQQRDAVVNQWRNYQRIRQSRQDQEAMANAGELPILQVDQARQDELRAEVTWVRAVREYQEQLDQFKVLLGLPADARVALDPAEIEGLRKAGMREIGLDALEAIAVALRRRLDLLTAQDGVADAERAAALARNGLAPDVGLRLSSSVSSEPSAKPAKLQVHRGTHTAALEADLPLRRREERNAYREALIALERARRAAEELRDQVKLSVREELRTLREAAQSYRIQLASVELAERRERGSRELLRRGEATTRDLLDANESLVTAQNGLTQTLIDYTLARLALWRDTELLRVGEDGVWQEVSHVEP